MSLLLIFSSACTSASRPITFAQLISKADEYNGKTVTLEAFYFSGFRIDDLAGSLKLEAFDISRFKTDALTGSLKTATSVERRMVPVGTLVWVEGGIPQELQDKLFKQSNTTSGYIEYFGKLKIWGKFETGGEYGHFYSYQYQINITRAELLEWTPPPSTSILSTGDLQIKVANLDDRPLPGAKVVSEEQPFGQLKVTGLTDTSGKVLFSDIISGDYMFNISLADYAPVEMTVIVQGGQINTIPVTMPAR